jgi:hypothetical protein
MRELVRFFRVVPPVPPLMVTTFIVVSAISVGAVAVDPRYAPGTLDAVILLQLFAVSSGFSGNARRGYYDLLLTRGQRRILIAVVHWALSVAPGLLSWAVLAVAEMTLTGGSSAVGVAPGTLVALVVTSTIGWAITVPLPRFAGAIGWVITVAMAAALCPEHGVPAALTNMVYPLAMVGRRALPAVSVLPAVTASAISMVAALGWIERVDLPLEASQ